MTVVEAHNSTDAISKCFLRYTVHIHKRSLQMLKYFREPVYIIALVNREISSCEHGISSSVSRTELSNEY